MIRAMSGWRNTKIMRLSSKEYALLAREKHFQGLFAVVSDPVDLLCQTVLLESNKDPNGNFDGLGLFPEQIEGYGLGVMHARARYYAAKDPTLASYLDEGRAYGPHGQGLIIANSVANYNDEKSKRLTELALTADVKGPRVCEYQTICGSCTILWCFIPLGYLAGRVALQLYLFRRYFYGSKK